MHTAYKATKASAKVIGSVALISTIGNPEEPAGLFEHWY
jgi:hypothetical protein